MEIPGQRNVIILFRWRKCYIITNSLVKTINQTVNTISYQILSKQSMEWILVTGTNYKSFAVIKNGTKRVFADFYTLLQ